MMATLPSSLLQRLYEPHSLRNTESGFQFMLKNRLAPSTLVGIGPLAVGNRVYEAPELTIWMERPPTRHGRPLEPLVKRGSEIASNKALPFAVNTRVRIAVDGERLAPGVYELSLTLHTKEVGKLTVKAVDTVE